MLLKKSKICSLGLIIKKLPGISAKVMRQIRLERIQSKWGERKCTLLRRLPMHIFGPENSSWKEMWCWEKTHNFQFPGKLKNLTMSSLPDWSRRFMTSSFKPHMSFSVVIFLSSAHFPYLSSLTNSYIFLQFPHPRTCRMGRTWTSSSLQMGMSWTLLFLPKLLRERGWHDLPAHMRGGIEVALRFLLRSEVTKGLNVTMTHGEERRGRFSWIPELFSA